MRRTVLSRAVLIFGLALFAVLTVTARTAFAYDYYGAIAYSPDTRSHGYSYNHPSRARAEAEALTRCQDLGEGCTVAAWFLNACGALALADEGNGYGAAWGGSRGAAEKNALRICNESNSGCHIERWVCTSR
jgi:hypothetical protein